MLFNDDWPGLTIDAEWWSLILMSIDVDWQRLMIHNDYVL
jgi:hypothetical protein